MYQDEGVKVANQTPVVGLELQRLEKQQMELSEIVAALEGRLSIVMREPEPSQNKNLIDSAPAQSQLAVMLRQRVQEAESLSNRLSSIVRRLEI